MVTAEEIQDLERERPKKKKQPQKPTGRVGTIFRENKPTALAVDWQWASKW